MAGAQDECGKSGYTLLWIGRLETMKLGSPYAILRSWNLILHIVRNHERLSEGNEIIRSVRKVNLAPVWQICGQGVEPQPGEAREEVK